MSVFHSVPGVPCAKMERFAGCAHKNLRLASSKATRGWRSLHSSNGSINYKK
jgi:hypothetical protein